MERWAHALTAGATNDMQRAKMLCEAVGSRAHAKGSLFQFEDLGTAMQAFKAWNESDGAMRCQELAYLYVALARALGLPAYFVYVQQEWDGSGDLHACAAVFIEGDGILADPTSWFGVPHKTFAVLDDSQTAALHLSAVGDLAACKLARNLAPGLPIVHEHLFEHLRRDGLWKEAQEEAEAMAQLEPQGAMTLYALAVIAFHQGKSEEAISLLRRAIESAPLRDVLHIQLGDTYARLRSWREARACYEKALGCPSNHTSQRSALSGIASAEAEARRASGDLAGALASYERAIQLKPDSARAYLGRASVKETKGDADGARGDYSQALRFEPGLAEAYARRGLIEEAEGQLRAAITDYKRAVDLEPSLEEAYQPRIDHAGRRMRLRRAILTLTGFVASAGLFAAVAARVRISGRRKAQASERGSHLLWR